MGVIRLTVAVLLGAVLCACGPGEPEAAGGQSLIPAVPQVADENLRRQLNTLREMVTEHGELALPSAKTDEKTSRRLELLQQGFEDLSQQCLENLDPADDGSAAVREFLEACASAMRGDKP